MFDAKVFVDQLLSSGKELAKKTQELAENKFGIPESGPERDRMLAGLGKGAIAGGLTVFDFVDVARRIDTRRSCLPRSTRPGIADGSWARSATRKKRYIGHLTP